MQLNRFTRIAVLGLALGAMLLNGCGNTPRRTLNTEDKTSDMYWLFSQFNENYAPLEYKSSRYSFNYDDLKSRYLNMANATKNNDEFYALMFQFVSEFKDAHTSASLNAAQLPARAKVAYLGFSGKRQGDHLIVTELLPTIAKDSNFPIKVGDQIIKLDGNALKDVVTSQMIKWRNLGQDEANLTYHMNRIFNRVSIANGLPAGDTAVLTVMRDKKEQQIALPWIVKDLYAFNQEQKAAAKKPEKPSSDDKSAFAQEFQLGFLHLSDGKIEPSASVIQTIIRGLPTFDFWHTFQFIDTTPVWTTRLIDELGQDGEKLAGMPLLAKERNVPATALPIDDAKTYPAYISREKVLGADGKETGATKLVGYIYLDTFSPAAAESEVVKEFSATLEKFQAFGVEDIIIDLIDNGGGSLTLGMKLAQALSKDKVVQPDIQFCNSETWLDEFEKSSLMGDSDAERELSRRVFEDMKSDLAAGHRLSRRMSVEALQPFAFQPNAKLTQKFNIVLLTNEMCASMCDIFTGILKDNGMAKIVGSRTMGAGGNVVNHYEAPNSHINVRQTESLMVRKDGSYIENNGVDVDVPMTVSESVQEKYAPVRAKALELILKQPAPAVASK